DGLVGGAGEHEILEVEDDIGDVFLHALDHVEFVERVVEANLGDRRARDRGEQRAAETVAERVAEAGLERGDREPLQIAFGLAGFYLGSLDDQHVEPSRSRKVRVCLGGTWITWSRARR